jgi:hypothetical protein
LITDAGRQLDRWHRGIAQSCRFAVGENRQHARAALGRAGIDALDDGMGKIGATKPGMDLVVEIPVVGVTALPSQQPPVFSPSAILWRIF